MAPDTPENPDPHKTYPDPHRIPTGSTQDPHRIHTGSTRNLNTFCNLGSLSYAPNSNARATCKHHHEHRDPFSTHGAKARTQENYGHRLRREKQTAAKSQAQWLMRSPSRSTSFCRRWGNVRQRPSTFDVSLMSCMISFKREPTCSGVSSQGLGMRFKRPSMSPSPE